MATVAWSRRPFLWCSLASAATVLLAAACGGTVSDKSNPPGVDSGDAKSGADSGDAKDSGAASPPDTSTPVPDTGTPDTSDGSADVVAVDACAPVLAGTALQFSTTTDTQFVSIPNQSGLDLATGLTIEAWVSVANTNISCIVCRPQGTATNDTFALWLQSGYLDWGINAPSPTAAASAPWTAADGTWHHLAATYDGTTQAEVLYVDGAQAATLTNTQGAPIFDSNPLLIGADIDNSAYQLGFNGTVDEVKIFSAVRTAQQIATDMSGHCSPVGDPTLAAYYDFNEGTGNVAHDSSGHQFHGALGQSTPGGVGPQWVTSTAPF